MAQIKEKKYLFCMGISPCFSTTFAKGDNFCDFQFDPVDYEALLLWIFFY